MTKTDALRRFFLPCFFPSSTTSNHAAAATPKTRLSTSLRDDLPEPNPTRESQDKDSNSSESTAPPAPSRPSKTMVIGTVFGTRRGHVWLCFQHDRLSIKPLLLLELSITTSDLVKEIQSGLVRIALESRRPDSKSCPLRSVPVWNVSCNGKRVGFGLRRRASEQNRMVLKTMESITVGAGVIPSGFGPSDSDAIMYMRANYEHVVGSANSESFHLVNPDENSGQELSVFLMRSS